MASNCTTIISIRGKKNLIDFLENKRKSVETRKSEDHNSALIAEFYDNMVNDGIWFDENVGARWCYHDDFEVEVDSAEIITISNSDYPEKFIKHLFKLCSAIDPECIICGDYEDETCNPVGGFATSKKGFINEIEVDYFEYPDEGDYLDEEGEVDYDKYNLAMEKFYEDVAKMRTSLRNTCLEILDEQE